MRARLLLFGVLFSILAGGQIDEALAALQEAAGNQAVGDLLQTGLRHGGALISATINNPDVVYFFDQKSLAVLIPLVVLAILSNWSTCDACLYNAAMGFTNTLPGFTWRRAAILGSIIGLIALLGIAARNGIMLVSHIEYLRHEERVTDLRQARYQP